MTTRSKLVAHVSLSIVLLVSAYSAIGSEQCELQQDAIVKGPHYRQVVVSSEDPVRFIVQLIPVPTKTEQTVNGTGAAEFALTIDSDGKAISVHTTLSSGDSAIDKELNGMLAKSTYGKPQTPSGTLQANIRVSFVIENAAYCWTKGSQAIYLVCTGLGPSACEAKYPVQRDWQGDT